MAFLVYFFVLLAMASSVLFGLDWVNAPLRPTPSQEQAVASDMRSKFERAAHRKTPPASASVPIGRIQPTPSEPTKTETVGQQSPEARGEGPRDEAPSELSAAQSKPASVPEQQSSHSAPPAASEAVQAATSDTQSKPEPVAEQSSSPANAASPGSAAVSASREPEKHTEKSVAKRDRPRHASRAPESRSSRASSARRRHDERAPDWALRGAEDTRREAEQERRTGAPAWAIEGAEAARREAGRNAQAREPVQPFWERENGWHFPW